MESIPVISDNDLSGEITFLPSYPKGKTHTNFPVKVESLYADLKEGDRFRYRQKMYTIMEIESNPVKIDKIVIYKCLPVGITKPDDN